MSKSDLPGLPSGLLRAAVNDCIDIEQDPRYLFDMQTTWHQPKPGSGKCAVCMAGAVIACRLGVDVYETFEPCDAGETNGDKLRAIDCLRRGMLGVACRKLNVDQPTLEQNSAFDALIMGSFSSIRGRADWDTYLAAADLLESWGM